MCHKPGNYEKNQISIIDFIKTLILLILSIFDSLELCLSEQISLRRYAGNDLTFQVSNFWLDSETSFITYIGSSIFYPSPVNPSETAPNIGFEDMPVKDVSQWRKIKLKLKFRIDH